MHELPVPSTVDPADPSYVENPVTTERFHFHSPPDDPESDPLAFDCWTAPGMRALPSHVHPRQDESFTVADGTLELVVDGDATRHDAGETVTVPRGTPHTWRTGGDDALHVTIRIEPALQTEGFLRDLAALGRRGALDDAGTPSSLQVAALYDAYGYDLLHLASPPLAVQKLAFGALAPLARRLGYRANPVARARDDDEGLAGLENESV
ncbi:cupin domain-containing protein [Halorubellus litoreus]|uniref:Cupin domain-containing protein n=1 Tax=Halorubellus litoreus TaxID=755308 RepID=A0ABD5VHM1_9EURY